MISSLISNFKFTHRRLLFLSAHKVVIYHWNGSDLTTSYLFDGNEEGRAYFERYLNETAKLPTYILTDFFKEEYRQDTIPHVFGPDRRAILTRKRGRLFRDTPYFYYRVIGREQEGRKDDRVLMTALTDPNLVTPWVQLLDNYKVPLAGIYSLSLFTESILRHFENPSNHMLIVSLQSISGLRQTFLMNKQFRISRLVQMPRYGTEPYAPHIGEEVEKIRRYLHSLRMITQEDPLKICFLLSGDLLEDLKKDHQDTSTLQYEFYDIDRLLKAAGSSQSITTPFSDKFFAHQVLKQKPANYYASSTERRFNTMRKLRHSMVTGGALLLMGSAVWSGLNFMDGLSYKHRSMTAENKSEFYQQRYQLARESLPETPVEPEQIKTAVEMVEEINKYKTSPVNIIRVISSVMGAFPTIRLDNFQWQTSVDPEVGLDGSSDGRERRSGRLDYADGGDNDNDFDYYQIARIEAHLEPFNGDYRKAIDRVNEFVDKLGARRSIREVKILSQPLDVSSEASLQGNTETQGKEARFSIRVVMGLKHAA